MPKSSTMAEAASNAPRRPADWTALERLQIVAEASKLPDVELGGFLRSKGLHEASLAEWREAAIAALQNPSKRNPDSKVVRELQRQLLIKDKALAEMTALAVLKKRHTRFGGTRTTTLDRRSAGGPVNC